MAKIRSVSKIKKSFFIATVVTFYFRSNSINWIGKVGLKLNYVQDLLCE